LVDEALRARVPPAALADGDFFSLDERKNPLGNQGIVENNIGLAKQPGRAHGEEVGCPRPGADEIDRSPHCTSPAATLWWVEKPAAMLSGVSSRAIDPPAKKRQRASDRGLVGLAEIAERGERLFGVLALAQQESVEAAALQVVEVVASDLAHGAQLAPVAIALAQEPRDREPPAVAELGEVHFDARDAPEPVRDRRRIVGRLEAQHLALFRRRRALGCDPTPFDERCHTRAP